MPLKSMTGFSSVTGQTGNTGWRIEIKSVNGKGLDVRSRVPGFLDFLDLKVKDAVRKALVRGSVNITILLEDTEGGEVFQINEDRLEALIETSAKYGDRTGVAPARLDGLLAIRGVAELTSKSMSEDEIKILGASILDGVSDAIKGLQEARTVEGERLKNDLNEQLGAMRVLTADAAKQAGDRVTAMRARFTSQLDRLLGDGNPQVSRERLDAEIAVLAVKADIQEELDRLVIHFDEAERLLGAGEAVGRRLDFLCQEFNREANTLCSKSGDADLTKIGLDLKATIDQFREQVQNIE